MKHHSNLTQSRHSINHLPKLSRSIFKFILLIGIFAIATPALADYLGPDRVKTETVSVCKVVLNECRYVAAKDSWRYVNAEDWSCSNESKPWKDYPDQPSSQGCFAATAGDKYWGQEVTAQEVTTTYPPAAISRSLQNCTLNNGWCVTSPQLALSGSEPVTGYSINLIEGTRNGQIFACSGASCSVPLNEGNNNFTYWALSSWGDSSTMGILTAKVDTQLPDITGTFTGTLGSNSWYITPVSFTGSASDATSGLASFTCTLDGSALGSCNSINVNSEGSHTIVLTARDNAGRTNIISQNASLDTQNPVLTAALGGTLGSNNWYTAAELNASASDPIPGSGLAALEYDLDASSWTTFPVSGVLTLPDGKHSVDLRAVDTAGRTVSTSRSFWLDTVEPDVTLNLSGTLGSNNWYTTNLNLTASASDSTSGVELLEYSLNNGAWTGYITPLTLTDGTHNLSFWGQDFAGLVTQVDHTYKVDTRVPQIGGSLSGVPGTNGWYISDVILSASASDPAPGSGIEGFSYILNGDVESPYTNALTLSNGQHTLELNAQDKAGLSYSTQQTIKVDTIHPSLNIGTTLPNWIKDSIALRGTAGDNSAGQPGSGVSKVEISFDNGQTWQPVVGTTSWGYTWNTQNSLNGIREVQVRAIDNAGLITKRSFSTGVDNQSPKISLPDSWYQWDTVTLDIRDDDSGLAEARVEISDPEERWPARIVRLGLGQFPMDFKWDRRFGDDTVAPLGVYNVRVVAFDKIGNVTRKSASINILLGVLPAGPTATPQSTLRPTSTSTPIATQTAIAATSTPSAVVSTFGEVQPMAQEPPGVETVPTPRTGPVQNTVQDWLQSVFVPDPNAAEHVTEVMSSVPLSTAQSTDSQSNVLWGAAAAGVIGAATAYAIEEKRKREEEEARQAAQVKAKVDAKNEAIQASQEAKREALLLQNWLQGQAMMNAHIEEAKKQGATSEQIAALKQLGATQGVAAAISSATKLAESLNTSTSNRSAAADVHTARKEAIVEEEMRTLGTEPEAWDKYMAQNALENWYRGEQEILPPPAPPEAPREAPEEKSWWEKSIDWIDNHQAEIALGIGVAVGVAAVVLTAGLALPAVAVVAGAAAVAGGTVALGTVGLNAYFDRPLGTNVVRNLAISAAAAAVTTGVGLALGGGVVQQAIYRVGNALTNTCIRHPVACGRVGAGIELWDKVEDLGLQAKLAVQTARRDPNAANTALELQLERLDNAPGNTTFHEIYETVADLLSKKNDEVAQITRIIANLGADTQIDEDGLIKFGAGTTPEMIEEAVEELRAIPGRTVWISGSTIYVNSPTKKALEAVAQLKTAVNSGADDATIDRLIDEVAAATSHGSGKRVVLGAWKPGGGYIGEAVEEGGVFYDTGDEVWKMLEKSGVDPWRVNEAFMRRQLDAVVEKIEFVGEDISTLLMQYADNPRPPYRVKEILWLEKNAESYGYLKVGNSWIKPIP